MVDLSKSPMAVDPHRSPMDINYSRFGERFRDRPVLGDRPPSGEAGPREGREPPPASVLELPSTGESTRLPAGAEAMEPPSEPKADTTPSKKTAKPRKKPATKARKKPGRVARKKPARKKPARKKPPGN